MSLRYDGIALRYDGLRYDGIVIRGFDTVLSKKSFWAVGTLSGGVGTLGVEKCWWVSNYDISLQRKTRNKLNTNHKNQQLWITKQQRF